MREGGDKIAEKRKIVIHGREYWMTFEDVLEEFGKEDVALAYEIWQTAKSECRDFDKFGTDYEDRQCVKCPKYRACMEAYAAKISSPALPIARQRQASGHMPIKKKEVESVAKKEVQVEKAPAKEKKSKAEKPKKNNELAIKVLGVLEALQKNGVTETTSTVLRNKLGTKNRSVIRQVMKGLAKAGKVVIEKKEFGKRKQYTYRLA